MHLLKYIGYYRFSGYLYPLLADSQLPVFKSGSTFEAAFNLYRFDSELRKLIITELEKIEVAVRTQMTDILSTAHGSFWMEDINLYANPAKHQTKQGSYNQHPVALQYFAGLKKNEGTLFPR